MEITEVRIKLMQEPGDRLQAFCSITLDGVFVIRDLKIIRGSRGPFVAMPSRKLNDRCSRCGNKNELRANYCNNCGVKLDQERAMRDQAGRAKLYADIAHPINTECREMIQARVLDAFESEIVRAGEPGYVCTYDDYGESEFAMPAQDTCSVLVPSPPEPASSIDHRLDGAEVKPTRPHASESTREPVHAEDDAFGAGIE